MEFAVKFRNGRSASPKEIPNVVLTQDNWDDYGYKTTFNATMNLKDEIVELGPVKVLHADQVEGYTPMPRELFGNLDNKYCSLGGDLEYYEKLFKCGRGVYRTYLKALNDVAYSESVRERFEAKEGYEVSLLRFSGAERTIADAGKLFQRSTSSISPKRHKSGFKVKFRTRVSEDANPILLEFDFQRKGRLPNRINVVIGYNGTGKTKLLSNLAIAASKYGYDDKKDFIEKRAGRFLGSQPPFKSVVVVSYSAFDTFLIPGQSDVEKKQLENDVSIFGYSYCGLRESVPVSAGSQSKQYRLKTPEETETEFVSALSRIRSLNRLDKFVIVLRPLMLDASFQRIGLTDLYADQDEESLKRLFQNLSSGHKVVLKIVADLAAQMNGSHPTLVLLDEPETHLHPPLLASLLKSVRACLQQFDGYAVVATHSPVVLQETPSRFVHVLRRMGGVSSETSRAPIETFGENVGVITQEVFNLDDGSTDWHETLRELSEKLSLEEIQELFDNKLGFGARSHICSLLEDEWD